MKPKYSGYGCCNLALVMSFGARICAAVLWVGAAVTLLTADGEIQNFTDLLCLFTAAKYQLIKRQRHIGYKLKMLVTACVTVITKYLHIHIISQYSVLYTGRCRHPRHPQNKHGIYQEHLIIRGRKRSGHSSYTWSLQQHHWKL